MALLLKRRRATALSRLRGAFGDAALAQVNIGSIGVTSGSGTASAWADARGAGFGSAWTFTGTAQPQYVQNAQGIWVLRSDGVNDTSNHNAGLASALQNVGAGFVFVVAATNTRATNGTLVQFSNATSATGTRLLALRDNSAGTIGGFATRLDTDTSIHVNGGTSDAVLRDDLVVADWTGNKLHVYQAGVEVAGSPATPFSSGAGSTSNTASQSVRLFSVGGTTQFAAVDIAAVVVGLVVPNAAQLAALHTFAIAMGAAA